MPLPWKKPKSKSGRISRFVSDLQQSPKRGGSLVVETGFPTSLIDLFVKNCDRLKKSSSKRKNKPQNPPKRCVSSIPSLQSPSLQSQSRHLQRGRSVPKMFDSVSVTEDPPPSEIEEISVTDGGVTAEIRRNVDDGDNRGEYVLMMVMFKVLMVAVLALSTKKLTVGITLSTFALIFLELVMARGFTRLNISPELKIRFNSLIGKLIGKRKLENPEESSPSTIEESGICRDEIQIPKSNLEISSTLEANPNLEEVEIKTIRDLGLKKQKSKRAKLKSKIVKKWRSLKKDKKFKKKEKEEDEEEEEESVTEVSSMFSESEISEQEDTVSNPPLLETFEEIEETKSKGDTTKLMSLIVIILIGLLSGKVLAFFLTLTWCLILRFVCNKSQSSL